MFGSKKRKRAKSIQTSRRPLQRRSRFELLELREMLSINPGTPLPYEVPDTGEAPIIPERPAAVFAGMAPELEGKVSFDVWKTVLAIDDAVTTSEITLLSGSELPSAIDLTNISTAKVNESGAIHIYASLNDFSPETIEDIESLGLSVVSVNEMVGVAEIWTPYTKIDDLALESTVDYIKLPTYGIAKSGSVNSAGDSISNADDVRTRFASVFGNTVNGSGIKIGVISDGVTNRASVQGGANPDLPSISVNSARPGFGNEGTAMLEIIHDLAPGAQLFFSSGSGGTVAMIDSINWLVAQGVDIIVDDLGFYDEHFFSDTSIAQTVSATIGAGVTYVSAAGNDAELHYQGQFSSPDSLHDFDTNPSIVDQVLDIGTIPVGGIIDIHLQWSDGWTSSANDFDLLLLNSVTLNTITFSANEQTGSQNPYETIRWTNTTGAPVPVGIAVNAFNIFAGRELEVFVASNNFDLNSLADDDRTTADSIFGHPAVMGAMSIGAINASEPGNDAVAIYSSEGTSTIYTNFATQTFTQRQTLDGSSIDGVETRIGQLGFFDNAFFGTSAAAPHVAAIAALVLDLNPLLTPAQVSSILATTAIDLTAYGVGYDNLSGAGRFDALGAVYKTYTPAAPSLSPGSDTGASNSDRITSITTPTFTGIVPANSFVRLFVNGVETGNQQLTGGNTQFSIISSALTEGTKSVAIRVAENSSVTLANMSNSSSAISVTIDNTAPGAPGLPDLTANSDTGASSIDNKTSDLTPTFNWTASNVGSGSALHRYYYAFDDLTPTILDEFVTSNTVTENITGFDYGEHTFTVIAVDMAGKVSSTSTISFTLIPSADFDEDGDVDGRDFLTWQRNYDPVGPNKIRSQGDANLDGKVDGADLLQWREQYGTSANSVEFLADFTGDFIVDSSDLAVMLENFGMESGATLTDGDADEDGDVDAADFISWQVAFGIETDSEDWLDSALLFDADDLESGYIIVTNPDDDDDGDYGLGDLSLREALALAGMTAGPNADRIVFTNHAIGTSTLTLGGDELTISSNVEIVGPGADLFAIDADEESLVFVINSGVTAEISGLTITNGLGGINTAGTLALDRVAVEYNSGTGIAVTGGTLTLTNSTVANNIASSVGGGIHIGNGSATLVNSTISSNQGTVGGGVFLFTPGVQIINCTITANRANAGAGIYSSNAILMHNTIVANNLTMSGTATSSDMNGGYSSSSTNNLIGVGGGFTHGVNGNKVLGYNQSAGLMTLGYYGGTTRTHRLLSTSQAVDAGNNLVIPVYIDQDQREEDRIYNGTVDIGALELAFEEL